MPELNLTNNEIILYIVLPIVGVILLISIILIILEVKVFSYRRIRKNYNELTKKYRYLNTLLTYQDLQYIQRLDVISRTNLLYQDVYSEYFKRYREIKDTLDTKVEELIQSLSIYVEDKNVKGYKNEYENNAKLFSEYEKEVNSLNDDLILVIQPEEDCRKESLMLKEKYREVKRLYESVRNRLDPVNEKFDTIFRNIDKKFNEFEEHVDNARYDEARELLPTLAKVLTQVKSILEVLPTYLEEVNEIIPQAMGRVLDKYNALLLTQLPLKHLRIEEEMETIKNSLLALRENFNELNVVKAGNRIESLHAILNRLSTSLDLEEDARNKFNDIFNNVISSYTDLEKNLVLLRNSIDEYEKFYIIDEEHQEALKELSSDVDTLSKLKRRIDYYAHGIEKTFFTDLLSKVNDLRVGVDQAINKYEAYKSYLESLKKNTDYAYSTINSRYLQLKKCEAILRDFNNPLISSRFNEDIDKSYEIMDNISRLLKTRPIDVNSLNELVNTLNTILSTTLEEIDNLNNYRMLASDNITFINRDRTKFNDVNNLLIQAESLYYSGEYKSSYDMSEVTINKLEDKEKVIDK